LFNLIRKEFYALKCLDIELRRIKHKYCVLKNERDKQPILLGKSESHLFERIYETPELWSTIKTLQVSYDELIKLSKHAQKVKTITESIVALQKSIPKNKFLQTEKDFRDYHCLLRGYRQILNVRKKLNILFSEIIEGENLYESKVLNDFLNLIEEQWQGEAYWFVTTFGLDEDGFIMIF